MNPFSPGPILDIKDFYGFKRQRKEVESIIEYSVNNSASKHAAFIGEPNTGKTTFLFYTEKKLKDFDIPVAHERIQRTMSNSFEFFNGVISRILSTLSDSSTLSDGSFISIAEQYNLYKQVIQNGRTDSGIDCEIEFCYDYHRYKRSNDPSEIVNEVPIENSLKQISLIYNEELKVLAPNSKNKSGKIAVFFDNFHNIIGYDEEDVRIDDGDNQHADEICEIIRNCQETYGSTKYLFFLASYPNIFNEEQNVLQKKLLTRGGYKNIVVNRYDDQSETIDLIKGCVDKLEEKHVWRNVLSKCRIKEYVDDLLSKDLSALIGPDYIKDMIKDMEKNMASSFVEGAVIGSIDRLYNKIHKEAQGRPYSIKKYMEEVFNLFEQPADISFVDLSFKAWRPIYKNVAQAFSDSKYGNFLSNYTLDQIYHLYLFSVLRQLSIKDISFLIRFTELVIKIQTNLHNDQYKNLSIEEYDKLIDNEDAIVITAENKIKNSLDIFIKDGIIQYNKDANIKYSLKVNIQDSNFIQNIIKSENDLSLFDTINKGFLAKYCYLELRDRSLIQIANIDPHYNIEFLENEKMILSFVKDPSSILTLRPDVIPNKLLEYFISNPHFKQVNLIRKSNYYKKYESWILTGEFNLLLYNKLFSYLETKDVEIPLLELCKTVTSKESKKVDIKNLLESKDFATCKYRYEINSIIDQYDEVTLWQKGLKDHASIKAKNEFTILFNNNDKSEIDFSMMYKYFNNYLYLSLIKNKKNSILIKEFKPYKDFIDQIINTKKDDYEKIFYSSESSHVLLYNIFILKYYTKQFRSLNKFVIYGTNNLKTIKAVGDLVDYQLFTCLVFEDGKVVERKNNPNLTLCILLSLLDMIKKVGVMPKKTIELVREFQFEYERIHPMVKEKEAYLSDNYKKLATVLSNA